MAIYSTLKNQLIPRPATGKNQYLLKNCKVIENDYVVRICQDEKGVASEFQNRIIFISGSGDAFYLNHAIPDFLKSNSK